MQIYHLFLRYARFRPAARKYSVRTLGGFSTGTERLRSGAESGEMCANQFDLSAYRRCGLAVSVFLLYLRIVFK
jgi:hypothetical protein